MANTPVKFTLPITPGQKRDYPLEQVLNQVAAAINAPTATPPQGVKTVLTTYTLQAADTWLLVDATAGAITVFLPSAAQGSHFFGVKKIDSSANAVTVKPVAGQTVDGAAFVTIAAQYSSLLFVPYAPTAWGIF